MRVLFGLFLVAVGILLLRSDECEDDAPRIIGSWVLIALGVFFSAEAAWLAFQKVGV